MKRRLFKLALFLLLGVIVNVAVAWGCAIWSPISKTSRIDSDEFTYRVGEPPFPPEESLVLTNIHASLLHFVSNSDGFGLRTKNESWSIMLAGSTKMGPDYSLYLHIAGWPFCSAHCYGYYRASINAESQEYRNKITWDGGIIAPEILSPRPMWQLGPFLDPRPLPIYPVWPGFAINTVFYAAILWLLTLAPFTARRMIRHKRGHCVKCGYDLRGAEHDVCPECGNEVFAKAKT